MNSSTQLSMSETHNDLVACHADLVNCQSTLVYSPLVGTLMPLGVTPDEVFAGGLAGEGVAILPTTGKVYAPLDGVVSAIAKTKHAITITTQLAANKQIDILIHLGIDTVELCGHGFHWLVQVGDSVTQHDQLGEFDLQYVKAHAKSLISPVVVSNIVGNDIAVSDITGDSLVKPQTNRDVVHSAPIFRISWPFLNTEFAIKPHEAPRINAGAIPQEFVCSAEFVIEAVHGIHARPASLLAKLAKSLSPNAPVYLATGSNNAMIIDMRSSVMLLSSGLEQGAKVRIYAHSASIYLSLIALFNELGAHTTVNNPHASNIHADADANTSYTTNHHTDASPNLNVNTNVFEGVVANSGIAIGKLQINTNNSYQQLLAFASNVHNNAITPDKIDAEIANYRLSVGLNREKLLGMISQNTANANHENSTQIIDCYLAIIDDEFLQNDIIDTIKQGYSALYAVSSNIDRYSAMLASTASAYLNERQSDFKHVKGMLLETIAQSCGFHGTTVDSATAYPHALHAPDNCAARSHSLNTHDCLLPLEEAIIVVAEEFSPSDIMLLPDNVVGLASVSGGSTSHAAILARDYGIPFIVGVHASILDVVTDEEANNVALLVADGGSGSYIDLQPSPATITDYRDKIALAKNFKNLANSKASLSAITKDGVTIHCLANINQISDIETDILVTSGASGIGLLRSEFLFFDRISEPSVQEQQVAYEKIFRAGIVAIQAQRNNQEKLDEYIGRVTIRTLDAGADKPLNYLPAMTSANPSLGVRGIRVSLKHESLLKNQLKAIVQAGVASGIPTIQIMLPMVTDIDEYRAVKQLLADIIHQYDNKEKLPLGVVVKLGIMVEVPSVVLLSELFAQEVDFMSIGTNDLTQYMLAADREDALLAKQFDYFHPSVLRAIATIVSSAKNCAKPVSVCGVMASDPLAIMLLIGLGVTDLSMDLSVVAGNKELIRRLLYTNCQQLAKQCLQAHSSSMVREILFQASCHNELTKYIND